MYPTDGLTSAELAYARQYADAIDGIPDSFDMFGPETIIELYPDNPPGGLDVDTARQFVRMLTDWHTSLDTLAAQFAGSDGRYSPPAVRFLLFETDTRERLASKFHRAVVALVAGTVDPTARVDHGNPSYCYSPGYVPEPSDCDEPPRPALRPVPTA
ncbi:hypothetical protein [Parafrankia sp. FMc2]|uniref:hypothetical protein n=1 Tax=Parafrankia sp. FMc2 TaxID=3233196 RepID=UPI0034D77490